MAFIGGGFGNRGGGQTLAQLYSNNGAGMNVPGVSAAGNAYGRRKMPRLGLTSQQWWQNPYLMAAMRRRAATAAPTAATPPPAHALPTAEAPYVDASYSLSPLQEARLEQGYMPGSTLATLY